MKSSTSPLLTPKEVAPLLRTNRNGVYRLIAQEAIPPSIVIKLSGRTYLKRHALMTWLGATNDK